MNANDVLLPSHQTLTRTLFSCMSSLFGPKNKCIFIIFLKKFICIIFCNLVLRLCEGSKRGQSVNFKILTFQKYNMAKI